MHKAVSEATAVSQPSSADRATDTVKASTRRRTFSVAGPMVTRLSSGPNARSIDSFCLSDQQ